MTTQESLIGDTNTSHTFLLDTIDNATFSERAKTSLRDSISAVMVNFEEIVTVDVTIAEKIRDFRDSIHTVEPIVAELIETSNIQFDQVRIAFDENINRLVVFIIATIGISFFLILILVSYINRSIEKPLEQLATATDDIVKGNYKRQISYTSQDEIGQLAQSFNKMTAAIQERNVQLNLALDETRKASQLKDEFMKTMSHELRTPLNIILGYSGIVKEDVEDAGLESTVGDISKIKSAGERLLLMVDNILDISLIESDSIVITKSSVNLQNIVDTIQPELKELASEKNLAFNINLDETVPNPILTDENLVTKIMMNLATNSIKFTEQGEVTVHISNLSDSQLWQIQVKDTGIGIPEDVQDFIFDRFRQVDGSTTREHGGSVLGLAIVKGLCDALGGTIQVDSEVGRGSTFTATLPIEQA